MIENNILDVQKLTKKYISKNGIETLALNQVSFGVNKKEMVAIMGRSGSGKSTLISTLTASGQVMPKSLIISFGATK